MADVPDLVPHVCDEVARQRRRRADRLLDQPVPGFAAMRLADVVAKANAAIDESGGTVDVATFLTQAGFPWQTTESVLAYLALGNAGAGER